MTVAYWLDNNAYAIGDIVQASTTQDTGLFFRCTIAGTSGAIEPFWPTIVGNTTEDGTVTWTAVSILSGDFQAPAPSAIIELFELELNQTVHGISETYRFHAGSNAFNNGEIVWLGKSYLRFPIEADGFEYNGQGSLPRPTIRVSNVLGTITAILLSLPNGIEGAKVTRIRTLAKYLDSINFPPEEGYLLLEDGDYLLTEDDFKFFQEPINPTEDNTAEFPREIYYIDRKSAENRNIVEFELAASFDLAGVRAPKRQCISNICQWRYRYWDVADGAFAYDKVQCPYIGTNYYDANDQPVTNASQDVCSKRLSGCRLRFGENSELPYGSFPGIGSASS